MSEYDEKTDRAFGLVLGNEAEWGYFSLNELKELGAERLVLEDFPKTFEEIKEAELKSQMSEEELAYIFNGKLSFDEIEKEAKHNEVVHTDKIIENLKEIDNTKITQNDKKSYKAEELTNTNVNISISDDKSENVKKYFDNLPAYQKLFVKLDEAEYNLDTLKKYFKDFEFNDGRNIETFNPFIEDEDIPDLVELEFFKDNDGEYRAIYSNLNSLLYHSDLDTFIDNLENEILNVEENKIAVKVGTEFILLTKKEVQNANIELDVYKSNVFVDEKEYPLYQGSTFNESTKVDKLIDSGQFRVYKVNEHLEEVDEKVINEELDIDEVKNQEEKILETSNIENNYSNVIGSAITSPITDKMFFKMQNNKEQLSDKVPNFKITNEIQAEKLTPSQRLNNNIKAISMLKKLEKREIELDVYSQEVLAKYVGWGGLADVFYEDKKGQWEEARSFLKENLTPKEYENAKESTLTAFYTPKLVIDKIYDALEKLGFENGNILEPSMGIGNFIGNIPDKMSKSNIYGIELDSVSSRIAQFLYPNANIRNEGFEKSDFSNNFFDVAIGNVPFGDFKIADKKYDKHNFLIHDYFFAKTIDKVRAGGIIAFITSSGTMDKQDNSVKRYIGSRCDLLGAIRLPNNTFKGSAGTEVTSDIIFLQKKSSFLDIQKDWYDLAFDDNGLRYNKYFVDNPNMVLGEMKEVSGRFGNTITCEPKENFEILLENALKHIKGAYESVSIDTKIEDIKLIPADDSIKNFSFTLVENEIYYRENSVMIAKPYKEKEREKIKDYIKLTSALKEVINTQVNDYSEQDIKLAQENLNRVYDDFSKKHKYINSKENLRLLSEDSNFPLVSSIEKLEE